MTTRRIIHGITFLLSHFLQLQIRSYDCIIRLTWSGFLHTRNIRHMIVLNYPMMMVKKDNDFLFKINAKYVQSVKLCGAPHEDNAGIYVKY